MRTHWKLIGLVGAVCAALVLLPACTEVERDTAIGAGAGAAVGGVATDSVKGAAVGGAIGAGAGYLYGKSQQDDDDDDD